VHAFVCSIVNRVFEYWSMVVVLTRVQNRVVSAACVVLFPGNVVLCLC
jgi:hypothetical protein